MGGQACPPKRRSASMMQTWRSPDLHPSPGSSALHAKGLQSHAGRVFENETEGKWKNWTQLQVVGRVCGLASAAATAVVLLQPTGKNPRCGWVSLLSLAAVFLYSVSGSRCIAPRVHVSRAGSTDLLPGAPLSSLAGCPCRDEEAHLATAARSWLAVVGRLAATSVSARTRFLPSLR